MTPPPLARCPVCAELRITFEHAGRVRVRAHSTEQDDPYAPGREGEDCAGSWQPVPVTEGVRA